MQLEPLESQCHGYQKNTLLWPGSKAPATLRLNKNQNWHLAKVQCRHIHENRGTALSAFNIDFWFLYSICLTMRCLYASSFTFGRYTHSGCGDVIESFTCYWAEKNRLTHLHLSMSPLGDQCEESEAAGEAERNNTQEIEDSVRASQAASTPVCHNNKTPLCYDDITSCSAPLLDARRALPGARGDHMRSAASDPLSCESMER